MSKSPVRVARVAFATLIAGMLALPNLGHAQSDLDVAEAQAFLGDWAFALDTEMGRFTFDLAIKDEGGKVSASVGSPDLGGTTNVTRIRKAGEQLVLSYDVDVQGSFVDIQLFLEPAGEALKYRLDAAGGSYSLSGTASKAGA